MDEWDPLQLVLEGYTTLGELEHLSFADIDDMCIARDVWNNAEAEAADESE